MFNAQTDLLAHIKLMVTVVSLCAAVLFCTTVLMKMVKKSTTIIMNDSLAPSSIATFLGTFNKMIEKNHRSIGQVEFTQNYGCPIIGSRFSLN